MRLRENKISFGNFKNQRRGLKWSVACFTAFWIIHDRRLKPKLVVVYDFFANQKKVGRFAKIGLVSGG